MREEAGELRNPCNRPLPPPPLLPSPALFGIASHTGDLLIIAVVLAVASKVNEIHACCGPIDDGDDDDNQDDNDTDDNSVETTSSGPRVTMIVVACWLLWPPLR
ncbi:hypothetical protein ElyMa_000862500 [Elysia marginata]|uniref:Uncharacterized protein n=1 Tax=Elysia marginata TaxID=1093978 RepID=A0AAV4H3I1_9GAST|nr:hypothetical protein ElyMa_000862500 [Elysia marginata]